MSEAPRITYVPRPDATPEAEASALADVYRFILDSHRKKNAPSVTSTGGDDMKGRSADDFHADEASLPR